MEQLRKYLQQQSNLGLTWERYLLVCEEMGQPVDYKKKPVDFSDLSEEQQASIGIYNQLQDTYVVPGMGQPVYLGKNLNGLNSICDIYMIDEDSRSTILEMINIIDESPIKKSRDAAKKGARAKPGRK